MKIIKIIVCTVILAIASFSCKKDDNNATAGKYYVKFKADGQAVEFVDQQRLQAAIGNSGSQHVLTVMGFTPNSNASLVINDIQPITVGNYDGYVLQSGGVVGTVIAYQNTAGETFGTNGANPEVAATVVLFNNAEVKGTFSGVIKQNGGTKTIQITEGEFFVKRIN